MNRKTDHGQDQSAVISKIRQFSINEICVLNKYLGIEIWRFGDSDVGDVVMLVTL